MRRITFKTVILSINFTQTKEVSREKLILKVTSILMDYKKSVLKMMQSMAIGFEYTISLA